MDVAVWMAPHLVAADQRSAYERFVRATFGPVATGWGLAARPTDTAAVRLARPTAVALVASLEEDEPLGVEASRLADGWLASRTGIDPALVDVVLGVAAQRGDRALFERMHGTLATETDQLRREQLITALGRFRDPELVRAALDLTLGDELDVRDAFGLLFAAFFDPRTRDVGWAWLESNVDALADKLPHDARVYLVEAGSAWCDVEHRARVDALFGDRARHWLGGSHALAQTDEAIDICIATTSVQAGSVRKFLSDY
jgi:alanyl aminopeptidase